MWSRAVMSGKREQTRHCTTIITSSVSVTKQAGMIVLSDVGQTVEERVLRLSLLMARPSFSISAYCKQLTNEHSYLISPVKAPFSAL